MFKINFYLKNDSIECLKENKIIGHGDNAYFIQIYEDNLDIEINGRHLFQDVINFNGSMQTNLPWFFENLLNSAFDISENKDAKVEFLGSYIELYFESINDSVKIYLKNKNDATSVEIIECRKLELIDEIKNEATKFMKKIAEINENVYNNNFVINLSSKIDRLLK